jgi:hypothetical protein
MIRSALIASLLMVGGYLLASPSANAGPGVPAGQSLLTESLVQQAQGRHCRRRHFECRERFGFGRDYRRCMRRRGC